MRSAEGACGRRTKPPSPLLYLRTNSCQLAGLLERRSLPPQFPPTQRRKQLTGGAATIATAAAVACNSAWAQRGPAIPTITAAATVRLDSSGIAAAPAVPAIACNSAGA